MAGGEEEKAVALSVEKEKKMADEKAAENEGKDESSSDEEPEPGLLDKPVMIFDQKRERKKVVRLSMISMQEKPKKEGPDYSMGKGVKLGDLEIAKYEIDRTLSTELKPLHKLLYGREGKATMVKKNIRAFCGFPFDTDTKEYANVEWGVEKFTNMGLQRLCEIFGLEVKGKRDELKEKVLKFLMAPYKTNKRVPQPVKPKPKKSKKAKDSSEEKSSKTKSKEVLSDDADSDEDDNENDDEGDEKEKSAEEDEDDAEKTKDVKEEKKKKANDSKEVDKKKAASKPKKAKATVIKLPTPSKKRKAEEKPKKSPKKSASPKKAAKKASNDDSDDDDEPLMKKAKPESPSDAMIEKIVRELLEDADLETVTMKIICKQVFNKFPGQDLSERKAFIKETVKKVIS